MAPTMRTHTSTRRGNRAGYQEHDDFEGLPVRQWRQEWVNITPPPQVETTQKNDIWAIELPHGMPKDSNLLPTHTQELLRAARSGRLYKRPAPAEEEEAEADAAIEKPEKKEEDPSTKGYMVKVWKQIPRNAEGPTISHLAKRRKNTVTLSSSLPAGNTSGPTVTKARVRRIDAAGNPYDQEVILTDGQPVDGEIISTTVVQAPTASTNADTAAGTPVRRRPPPPKRKAKGPGRGRKKKILPLPGPSVPQTGIPGAGIGEGGVKPEGATDGIKQEGREDSARQDSEMADGDDDEEGDDDGEDGDDGDEGDEDEGEVVESEKDTPAAKEAINEQDIKQAPSVEPPATTSPVRDADAMDISTDEPLPEASEPPPPTTLTPIQPPTYLNSPQLEGSPLRNVSVPSPTEPAVPRLPPISGLENSAPASELSMPSNPIPDLVPSVEAPRASSLEPTPQETTTAEAYAPVDTEMTDAASPTQPETTVQHKILSSIDNEAGQAVVEEITETTKVPLNDQPELAEPSVVSEVAIVSEVPPTQSNSEVPDAPLPVVEEPTGPITEPLQSTVPEPVGETIAEQPVPSPITQVTEVTELSTVPVTEVPTITEPPVLALPSLNPAQTEFSAAIPLIEEREPESPDLLGGLEAALDRDSESRTEKQPDVATELASVTAQEPTPDTAPQPIDLPVAEPIPEPAPAALNPEEEKPAETAE